MNESHESNKTEKKIFLFSLYFPLLFVALCWMVWLYAVVLEKDFYDAGLYPRSFSGLVGIITSPFVHGSFNHLLDNTVSFFLLAVALCYFYRQLAYPVFFLIYIGSGVCMWLMARSVYHIGASGLIYGMAFFLFFSGILRKHHRLIAISLLTVFFYGSMVWGIFPVPASISWEAHLFGAICGTLLAFYYRKKGPQVTIHIWSEEEEEEENTYREADEQL